MQKLKNSQDYLYKAFRFLDIEIVPIPDSNKLYMNCMECCFKDCCEGGRYDIPHAFEFENNIEYCCSHSHHYSSLIKIKP